MSCFLGFDGGGTKTESVLLDGEGQVVGQGLAGPSNPVRVGFPEASAALATAADAALAAARAQAGQVQAVCAGLAGAGRPRIAKRVNEFLRRKFPQAAVYVTTDLEVALEAAAGSGPGVVLIAGTGSAAYGRNAAGETARAGGWGPWTSDEGSAFDLGRQAVRAVAHAREGRGPATQLEAKIFALPGCPDWETLVERIAKSADDVLPQIFPLVVEAAGAGDSVAREIVSGAAVALADLAGDVIRSLHLEIEEFTLTKSGGVFERSPHLDRELSALLLKAAPRAHVEALEVSPAVGAARLARRRAAQAAGEAKGHGAEE